jgi:hypothetical protein
MIVRMIRSWLITGICRLMMMIRIAAPALPSSIVKNALPHLLKWMAYQLPLLKWLSSPFIANSFLHASGLYSWNSGSRPAIVNTGSPLEKRNNLVLTLFIKYA